MSTRETGNDPYGFGVLNKITKSEIHKKLDPGRTKFLKASSDLVRSSFEEDILDNTGPYIGVVLRVDADSATEESSYSSWVGRIFGKDDAPSLIQIKARIPELHAMYPCPPKYDYGGSASEQVGNWQKIIDLYPTFTSMSEGDADESPMPGQLVWLDFGDKTNYHNGIYIKPVRGAALVEADATAMRDAVKLQWEKWHHAQQYGPPGKGFDKEAYRSEDTNITLDNAKFYTENRVRRNAFDSLPSNSHLLVRTKSGKKIHTLANDRLNALNEAWTKETGKPAFLIASGHRKHRWRGRQDYEKKMIKKYGSVREGKKWMAYASAHETGLAIDFGNNGLEPKRKSKARQLRTLAFRWLRVNAHKFGFTPYKKEPWHWELLIPRENWANGTEFSQNYAVHVTEQSTKSKKYTNDAYFNNNSFV